MLNGSGKTIAQLMNEADLALYRSKASGKNKVTCFSPECVMPGSRTAERLITLPAAPTAVPLPSKNIRAGIARS